MTTVSTPASVQLLYRRAVERASPRMVHAGVVLLCVLVGVLAAVKPLLAVSGVIALALVLVVVIRPIVGLCALLYLSFLEVYSGATGALSLTKLLGGVLLLTWVAVVSTSTQSGASAEGMLKRHPLLSSSLAVFLAWACISLVWAIDTGAAQTSIQRYALNFALFPIALVAIRAPRHVLWLVVTFIAGALTAAAFGLGQGGIEDPEAGGRLKGAGINPNQLGSYLVVSMVFAATLAANVRWSPAARVTALATACVAAVCVFLTLSRGALVGMAVALVAAPFVIGRGRRWYALALAGTVVIAAAVWFAALSSPGAVDRIRNPERGGGSGRADLWKVGWRMVDDQPVHGVGAGNFSEASIRYLLRPGATERDEYIVDDRKVAHNIYLTVLSELGIVGLALFVFVILACLWCALRAARAFAEAGNVTLELVSRALFVGVVSLAVVGFFSSALYVKQFWILLAAAPAFLAVAERSRLAAKSRPTVLGSPP